MEDVGWFFLEPNLSVRQYVSPMTNFKFLAESSNLSAAGSYFGDGSTV